MRQPSHGKAVDREQVFLLYEQGLSMSEIGRRLGHPRCVIHYHLKRNGYRIRSQSESMMNPIKTEEIARMYFEEGLSAEMIGKKIGMTAQGIFDRLKDAGYKLRTAGESMRLSIKLGRVQTRRGEKAYNWKGRVNAKGYIALNINGKYVREHRHIWELANGEIPTGYIIHHINGIKDDNRLENLVALPREDHNNGLAHESYQKRIRELEDRIRQLKSIKN